MKKKLSVVLAVVLTLTLLLTYATFAVGWVWPSTEYKNMLDMTAYPGEEPMSCGPCSGVSIGRYYREVIDRDGNGVISEDFEWGSNGDSLWVAGGELDWTVWGGGGDSVAEIDTEYAQSGDKSARFYYDDPYKIQAIHMDSGPTWRGFYLKKEAAAVPYTTTWYDGKRIYVRVRLDMYGLSDLVEYYDGDSWKDAAQSYLSQQNPCPWYRIEFRNIDWEDGTYDIRLYSSAGVSLGGSDAKMDEDSSYGWMTEYGSYDGDDIGRNCSGAFWIDDILETEGDYPALPDVDDMYYHLIDCMTTSGTYGPCFVEMAQEYGGYDNFGYVYDGDVNNEDDYWAIKEAIDNGWPVALGGDFDEVNAIEENGNGNWPPDKHHYIAIRGYRFYCDWYGNPRSLSIICTDNYCRSDKLVLDWDELISKGDRLKTITIRDDVIESFEWGSDGTSLEDWQSYGGNLDWTVTADGDSVVEIDTWLEHSGTRCARFYYDGDPDGLNYVRGYYSEDEPIWRRGFWLKTDGDAAPVTVTGNGEYAIVIRVHRDSSNGVLQYYYGGWENTNCELSSNKWHFIEFKHINWDAATYDIYVDSNCVQDGVHMHTWTMYNGLTGYYSYYEGSFWIDDIIDLIPEPEATTLELLPEADSNPLDTYPYHLITATVYDQFGCAMEGVDVTWTIEESGPGSFVYQGTTTDAYGQAYAWITSSVPGTSTVTCEVTGNPSVYYTATKDWIYTPEATTLELLPETGSSTVDTTHNLTATVYDQFGYEMAGVAVTWNISGVGSFSGTPEGVTDADGQADAMITSSVPGTSTVRCEVTGNTSVYDTATKDWAYPEDFEYALEFDGDNYVFVPDSSELRLGTGMTVSVWIQPTEDLSNWARVVGKGTKDGGVWKRNYGIWRQADGDILWQICSAGGTGNCWNDGGTGNFLNVPVGTRAHLVGTYDGSEMKVYRDGVLAKTLDYTQTPYTTIDPLTIAYESSGNYLYYKGIAGDVRIYNRALSETEVSQLYNGDPLENGQVGHWEMDEGAGRIVEDSSSYGNDGYILPLGGYSLDFEVFDYVALPSREMLLHGAFGQMDDFEWGEDGDPLDDSEGGITWTISKVGSEKVEIDEDYKKDAFRSARFYRDGTNHAWAQFSQSPLSDTQFLSFYLMTDGNSNVAVYHGNGQKVICYYYYHNEVLRWYDGTSWHDTSVTFSPNTWYLSEVKNVDWVAGTYDIYHNGDFVETANMRTHTAWNNIVRFYNTSGTSSSWLDSVTIVDEWTLEAWSYAEDVANGYWNTLFRGLNGDHQVILQKDTGELGTYDNGGSGFHGTGYDGTLLEDGWHHIAVVGSGGTQTFYVDGWQAGSSVDTQSCTDISAIGNYMYGSQQPWGKVADVRIWSDARSQSEIQANMCSELTGTEDGLVGYWKFDEGSGDDVYDSAGDNDGWVVHALDFDGSDDYVDLPNDLGYTTKVSAFAWFKHCGTPAGNYHIVFGGQELEISVPSPSSSWVTPDSGSIWTNPENAYDDSTTTKSSTVIWPYKWSLFYTYGLDETLVCSKVRTYTTVQNVYINKIDVDGYWDGAWHDIYQGSITYWTWQEHSIGSQVSITQFRVRYYNSSPTNGWTVYLHEGDFWGIPVSTEQIRTGVYTDARYVSNHGSGLCDAGWHYIGFTFDGSVKKSYIDGEYVGQQTGITGDLVYSFANRRMGRFGSSTTYYLHGQLSELSIWDYDLSLEEIQANMYAELDGTESGLVACWKADEGTGSTIYDSTENDNHGEIQGATWVLADWVQYSANWVLYIPS